MASNLRLNGGREFDHWPPDYRSTGTAGDGWPSSGGHTTSVCNQPPWPTQPPTLCGTGNEYRPKCGDALRLEVKSGWLIPLVDKRVGGWQVKLCDRSLTRPILSALEGDFSRKDTIQMSCLQLSNWCSLNTDLSPHRRSAEVRGGENVPTPPLGRCGRSIRFIKLVLIKPSAANRLDTNQKHLRPAKLQRYSRPI